MKLSFCIFSNILELSLFKFFLTHPVNMTVLWTIKLFWFMNIKTFLIWKRYDHGLFRLDFWIFKHIYTRLFVHYYASRINDEFLLKIFFMCSKLLSNVCDKLCISWRVFSIRQIVTPPASVSPHLKVFRQGNTI